MTCIECLGTGLNHETLHLARTFCSWAPRLTKSEEIDLLGEGVSRREIARLRQRARGYDTVVLRSTLVEIRARRKNLWGPCDRCDGEKVVPNPNPSCRQLYEGVDLHKEWQPVEPERGSWWQLWENPAPDGYPVSPAFQTPDELAFWCVENLEGNDFETWRDWILEANPTPTAATPPLRLQSETVTVFTPPKPPRTH